MVQISKGSNQVTCGTSKIAYASFYDKSLRINLFIIDQLINENIHAHTSLWNQLYFGYLLIIWMREIPRVVMNI